MFRFAVVAFAAAANAATLSRPVMPNNVMKLRGGLMDIDGANVAKYAVLLNGIDAGLSSISGAKSAADIVEGWTSDGALAAAVGYYLFADAVLGGGETAKAVVMGSLPGLIGAIKGWLNGGKAIDLSGSNVSLIITAFLTYCLHTGTILDGDLALKIVGGLNLVNGLGGMFAPDLVSKLPWDGAGSPALAAGVGAAVLALATGSGATTAVAYSVVPTLFKSVDSLLISKSVDGDENVALIMMLIQAAVVATNLA